MSMDAQQVKNAAQASIVLRMESIPYDWLKLIYQGWTLKLKSINCGTGPHSFVDTMGVQHNGKWAWYNEKGEFYGCVCHSTPWSPQSATIDSYVFDQGGFSNCSHCNTTIDLDKPHETCPSCHSTLKMGEINIPHGGSDF